MRQEVNLGVVPTTESERDESGSLAGEFSQLAGLLHDRLRFESLLSRLSADFIHLLAENVDSQIERALEQIVDFLGIERSGLGQFSEDGRALVVTHSYAIPGFPPFPRADLAVMFPWYTGKVRQGEVLRFTRLPDELPPEAAAEKEYCLESGLRSQLTIPFKVGNALLGGIGFESFGRQRDWPNGLIRSLQLLGEVFANALARKRADLVLRESEGRFRLMADRAPVMVWMSGPDKLCTYFNKPWLEFTGRPLERQVGEGWSEGVHPDDLPRCLDTYIRAFDARQEFRMEYRLQRYDGEYRWILDMGVPRFKSDGAFQGYIGSCIDITDQKRGEVELRESESRLRLLLESTHAVPWVADAQSWRFSYVGPQASKLLGYPPEAWYEENFWVDHIHPDDREAAVAFCLEHSRGYSDYQFEYRMVAADRHPIWIHDIVNVVAENGTPAILRGFMVDVTALRQAEEESRSLREQLIRVGRATLMGELAASIAHEINQPLCAIVSNAQTARRMLAGEGFDIGEVREALKDITEDGQRASAVVSRIRDFLQNAPAQRLPVDVNDLIREVAALINREMARRGAALKLELAENLPLVLGDQVQLQQVILNLLANGADAMDREASDIHELVIRSTGDGAGTVTVAVSDAGVGVDSQNLDRVFEAFFTTKPGGTGMGLAICKSIVEAHGGRIWANPNADGGTTFQFTLPGRRESAS